MVELSNKEKREKYIKEVGKQFILSYEPMFDDIEAIYLMHLHTYIKYRAEVGAIAILKVAKKHMNGIDFAQLVFHMSGLPTKSLENIEVWYNVVHHYWDNKVERE